MIRHVMKLQPLTKGRGGPFEYVPRSLRHAEPATSTPRRPGRGPALPCIAAALVMIGVVAGCSTASTPTVEVSVQTGKQTLVTRDVVGVTALAADAKDVVYLGGSSGISTLGPGDERPTPLRLEGHPTVLTMAVTPEAALYYVTQGGVAETVAAGGVSPQRLPFGELTQFSQIAVGHDGSVYLGDDRRNVLLKLESGAAAPTELDVTGVDQPGHMVIDGNGNLYASMDGKVVKIAKGGSAAEPLDGATEHAGGLAVDVAGNLYATDVQANTVARMPAGGGDWVQLPFNGLQGPTGITVDGAGNVYVLDRLRSQLIKLAAN